MSVQNDKSIKDMQENAFYIFLTIEGTLYEEVKVNVVEPLRTIRELIARIVVLFRLPNMDNGGNPIIYLLVRFGDDDEPDILEFDDEYGREQCLLDYNICPGDHLCLISRPIAGGSPSPPPIIELQQYSYEPKQKEKSGFGKQLLERLHIIRQQVYSSVFAPSEIGFESHMLVQVYLHKYEETEKIKELALESQYGAERRDYIPLQCKLRLGDTVNVVLSIYGRRLVMTEKKSMVWQGSFSKCSFDYFVPFNCPVNDELSCKVLLMVNGIPVGEMNFITRLSFNPRKLNSNIVSHKYKKVFISYAHKDESKVKSFHEGLKLFKIEHFFDRAYLEAGDIYPQVIKDYIDTADLFVLFWSENASKSDYVQKERKQALERAFPQVSPAEAAKLTIYPMSIEPRADLPEDMKENYHFGEM